MMWILLLTCIYVHKKMEYYANRIVMLIFNVHTHNIHNRIDTKLMKNSYLIEKNLRYTT